MINYLKKLQDRMANKGDEGFTLIELLIVIVVLGILAAVVVLALGNVNHSARQSACLTDAKSVETAAQVYNASISPSIGTESTAVGPDVITTASTAGIVVGQTVHDNTHPGTDTTVAALIDITHFSVPQGASAVFTVGDTLLVGAVTHVASAITQVGIVAGSPSTYANGPQAAKILNGYLRSWPVGTATTGYAISLSTAIAGDVMVYVPVTSVTGVDYESETSTTGCNTASL